MYYLHAFYISGILLQKKKLIKLTRVTIHRHYLNVSNYTHWLKLVRVNEKKSPYNYIYICNTISNPRKFGCFYRNYCL